jgi:hypothetical protein
MELRTQNSTEYTRESREGEPKIFRSTKESVGSAVRATSCHSAIVFETVSSDVGTEKSERTIERETGNI